MDKDPLSVFPPCLDIFKGPDRYLPCPALLTYIDNLMNVLEANSGILWKYAFVFHRKRGDFLAFSLQKLGFSGSEIFKGPA
jgi:hypothetical protein